jgi:hypothetical protein
LAADVAAFAGIDLDPVALVHEQRHLDDGARRQLRRLRHVGDGISAHAGLGLRHGQLHGRRHLDARRPAVNRQQLHGAGRLEILERVRDALARQADLLVALLVHEDDLVAGVVEVLDALRLGVHPRELLSGSERLVDDRTRVEVLQLRTNERATLPRLHVLELDDAPDVAVQLDVHAVLELVGADGLGHPAGQSS